MKDFSKDELQMGIIGAGVMGRGIAQVAAAAGVQVMLFDLDGEAVEDAIGFVSGMFKRAAEKGRMTAAEADAALARIKASPDLAGLAAADIVIEAVVEKLEVKQSLFGQLEELVSDECILATNTSSLSVTAVAASARNPGRVAGFHFFNPVPLMKLVEVISALRTDEQVGRQLHALTLRLGHTPVMVNDSPGFLVNHAGRGLITEGLRLLHENVTDVQTVDEVVRDCMGFRMGPFELMDLTGLDVTFPASQQVYTQYFNEPRVRPTPLQQRRYTAGLLGRKTGEGFYRYLDGQKQEHARDTAAGMKVTRQFWVDPEYPDLADAARAMLEKAGVSIDRGDQPASDSIIIVTPLGKDTSSTIVEKGLDGERVVAVDALFPGEARLTMMASPATGEEVLREAQAAFSFEGRAVALIRDSGGFISQRIVASIVNIASDIAQQGIAAPADIDTGARLALGYPEGPLALGDRIGPKRVLSILENLLEVYGDPRYRPSPWLKRRAQLGLSLLAGE